MAIVKRHGALFLTLCEHLLERGYDVRFRAEGTSMLPTIHDGDAVTVGPVDRDGIEAGEIVLYRRAGRPIAHRVAEIRTSADGGVVMMVARGDGKAGDDAPVAARAILGKVVSIERQAVGSTGRKRPNMASLMRHGMSSLKHAIRPVALLARSVAVCACVLGAAVAADAQMISGSYTGDGTDNRAITELGFQPDVVIIKGDATQIGVIRTSTMTGDAAKPITVTPGDLNGDGRQDLLLYNPDIGHWLRRVNLSTGWVDEASGLWSRNWTVAGRRR